MKLGNSGSGNTGKKYIKIKEGTEVFPENEAKAQRFALWFGDWYERLKTELMNKSTYDEDVLNDTFMRMYDKIRFGGLDIADYKAYFHRAFFTNFMQQVFAEQQSRTTPLGLEDRMDNTGAEEELIEYKLSLEYDIFDYVYRKYPVQQFELFKMYIRLKPAINYVQLSQITKISVTSISEIISKIRRDVQRHDGFRCRRRQTLRCCEW